MSIKVKVNCENVIFVEGYVDKLKFEKEKNGSNLFFNLINLNINKNGQPFRTDFNVHFKNRSAEKLKDWIKDGDLVKVEGKMRRNGNTKAWKIMGVHVKMTTPILKDISESEVTKDE